MDAKEKTAITGAAAAATRHHRGPDEVGHSYSEVKSNLQTRLRRVEGQVRGLQRMIDEDRYCVEVLIQIAAVRSALKEVGRILLEHHTHGCVRQAIERREHADEKIQELLEAVRRFEG